MIFVQNVLWGSIGRITLPFVRVKMDTMTIMDNYKIARNVLLNAKLGMFFSSFSLCFIDFLLFLLVQMKVLV